MAEKKKEEILEEIEIIDFDDDVKSNDKTSEIEIIEEPQEIEPKTEEKKESIKKDSTKEKIVENKQSIKNETSKKESKTNEKKQIKEKKSIKPVIISILVFLLLFGVVFALPFISDYFEAQKNPTNKNHNNTNLNNNNENNNEISNYKSGIDVSESLEKIKSMKSYTYENHIDVYVKDNKNETLTIKNNYTYSFNETKYKVEMNKVVADFSYDTVDYYEKLDDNYYFYINDITTKEYNKENVNLDKFNILYNVYGNTINYLINNHEVINEKQINVDDKTHINITLKTPLQLLNNQSVETTRIQNRVDISKLSIDSVNVELYFNENKELYKIEFSIEDKNAYQESIDGEIESSIVRHTFKDFNKVKDIIIPEI
ncbi:MAG: hypothetical protein IJO32_01985 [Bacilli bacterium]|nr:hypothetical protein [Bacilli bacterium]